MTAKEKLSQIRARAQRALGYELPDGVRLILRPVRHGELLLKSGGGEEVTLRAWLERILEAQTDEGRRERVESLLEDPETTIRLGVLQERVADAYIALGVQGAEIDGERVPFTVYLDDEAPAELGEHEFTVGMLRLAYGDDEVAALRDAIMRLSGVMPLPEAADRSFRQAADQETASGPRDSEDLPHEPR